MASHSSRSAFLRLRRWWSFALVVTCWLSLASAAQATTYPVTRPDDPTGPGNCPADCSLRQAIGISASGDTIQLDAAVYTLTQGPALLVSHSLTIDGAGRNATKIDGSLNRDSQGKPDRILKVTGGSLQIRELTFTGGTDGRDENFAFCSPCDTITANGGGALFNSGATVTLEAVSFDSNAGPVGGAIGNAGTLHMADVDFRANRATFGGGLFSRSGTVTAERVTIRDGGGGTRGGAVFLAGGTMTMTNSTVSGNGSSSTIGGGVVNRAGNLSLVNVTLTENLRGGLETAVGATTSVQNTILGRGYSDGTNGSCVGAGQNSFQGWTTAAPISDDLGNNLAGDLTCGTLSAPSQSGIDAKLAPATDNTGATPTAALLHGSPAIDAGNDSACPPSDQRGVMRAGQGAHCDIGAFEAIKRSAPIVIASSAPAVGSFDATLAATIDLAGEAGALLFRWGTSPTSLIETTELAAAGVVSEPMPMTVPLYGLRPSTTYYFEAVADNATGEKAGSIQQFTTKPGPPVVSNVEVVAVTDTTATIDFSIDPAGDATSYVISYDGRATAPVNIGSATGPQQLAHTLTGLQPGTDYSFDVIATNAGGSQGLDVPAHFSTDQQLSVNAGSPVTLSDAGNGGECPTAIIDWGDGTPADASETVTCSDDGHDGFDYALTAAHTYHAAGRFHIQIEYSTGDRASAWALISSTPPPDTPRTVQPTPTATPSPTPSPTPMPTFHQTVVVQPLSGTVLVKLKGSSKFVPLTAGQAVPLGSQIDVTKGKITLTSIPKAGGKPETATFYAGIFTVTQRGSITELTLSGPLAPCKAKKGKASAAAKKPRTRKLWGDGKGQFRTRGQYSAATIRGTRWLVQDSCAGTLTKVASGVVSVRDTVRAKTVLLRPPRSYLAKPR